MRDSGGASIRNGARRIGKRRARVVVGGMLGEVKSIIKKIKRDNRRVFASISIQRKVKREGGQHKGRIIPPFSKSGTAGFNSIVVRLKDIRLVALPQLLPCFNSIVVRLKAIGGLLLGIMIDSFQFHSGSIKRVKKEVGEFGRSLFQFHSGSIKRKPCRKVTSSCGDTFQFHSGSIKSLSMSA